MTFFILLQGYFFSSRVKSPPNPRLAHALHSEAFKIGALTDYRGTQMKVREKTRNFRFAPDIPQFFFIFCERSKTGA